MEKEDGIMKAFFNELEKETEKNEFFRKVLFTGEHLQLVLMSLKVGEEIGDEVHPNVDQFFRVETGEAKLVVNEKEEHIVKAGGAAVIPAGTFHNVINHSKTEPLRLYTIYTPPNHPDGTINKTKADAEAYEKAKHH
jgi:mannose-6-phosphate isomerase-like protein (cupin superfamily)